MRCGMSQKVSKLEEATLSPFIGLLFLPLLDMVLETFALFLLSMWEILPKISWAGAEGM
jgi:hypothetical protein